MMTHGPDGAVIPFDAEATAKTMGGCIVCNERVGAVGIYAPSTKAMRDVVARLSPHPIPAGFNSGIFYGLCLMHFAQPHLTRLVEGALKVKAETVPIR